MTSPQSLGKSGENYAKRLLKNEGYNVIDSNYRTKFGEIDIVAKDQDTICFIEVKTTTTKRFGYPEEKVNKRKLEKIHRVAEQYVKEKEYKNYKMRVEVISLVISNGRVRRGKLIKLV